MRESDPSREGSLFFLLLALGSLSGIGRGFNLPLSPTSMNRWHSYANGMMQPAFEQYCNWLESVR